MEAEELPLVLVRSSERSRPFIAIAMEERALSDSWPLFSDSERR